MQNAEWRKATLGFARIHNSALTSSNLRFHNSAFNTGSLPQ